MRRPISFAVSASLIGLVMYASTISVADAQVPSQFARKLGLETAWQSQVQVPMTGRGVVSTDLWIEPDGGRQFAVVELPERTIRIAADRPDRDGNPIGLDEAKKIALSTASRIQGSADGLEVKETNVPSILLVIVTCDGLVQTLDAETGKLVWATSCGSTSAPAFPAALSSAGVSVLHGERLYLLDWKTGKHKASIVLKYPASNSVAVAGGLAFVTDVQGRVQSYQLDIGERAPYGYVIAGRAVGEPVSLANQQYSAIASDAGYVYVFVGGDRPSEWIRYDSSTPITGGLSAGNNAFYVSTAGIVSKVTLEDRFGKIDWEFHTGQPTTAPPLVVSDTVYVATDSGDLAAVDDATGFRKWVALGHNVQRAVGQMDGKVMARSRHGELLVFNSETGGLLGRSRVNSMGEPIANQLNDRIYLITDAGLIQCFRSQGAELPTMIKPVERSAEDESTASDTASSGENIFEAGESSPFNAADPFGTQTTGGDAGGSDPFGGSDPAADPFGGDGADPFGGDGGGMDDPFGGDGGMDDPFGGF